MKRVALYVRVSTQEQKLNGLSIDSQIDALKEYCKENKYIIQGIYNDAGISARKSYKKRPALQRMIYACQTKQVDLVLFTKLDRFFRSVADYYECLSQMEQVPWRAIWEDYETETSAGVFKVNIMLAVAQSEADRTSERIKAVNKYRKEQGAYLGSAPTGYRLNKADLIKDENTKDAVQTFFDKYLSSRNIHKAIEAAHDHGLQLSLDTAKTMLRKTTYAGNAYGYSCEPYITMEQYASIQKSVGTKQPRREKVHNEYLFTGGLFRCKCCGRAMIGSFRNLKSGKNIRPYKFYHCVNGRNMQCHNNHSISEKRVEQFLLEQMETELEAYNFRIASAEKEIADTERKRKRLNLKLQRIGERYEDGDISRAEYLKKKDAVQLEIAKLAFYPEPKQKALPDNWRETYLELDTSHRRAFWYSTIESITFDGEGLSITF